MTKIIPEQKARQAGWGKRVLLILICALVLIVIAWAAAEFYGETIDNSTPAADTTTSQGQMPKG
ncbi:MAG TPA: hypothetical protein VGM46_11865 [Mesorhizobium sp.]|jgi:hypothetical protein